MYAKEITNLVKISNFGKFLKLPVVFNRLGTNGFSADLDLFPFKLDTCPEELFACHSIICFYSS